jgi:hypothetical protein
MSSRIKRNLSGHVELLAVGAAFVEALFFGFDNQFIPSLSFCAEGA